MYRCINAPSATGISTVGILTAYSSININVGGGSTEIATELAKHRLVRRLQCLWYLVDNKQRGIVENDAPNIVNVATITGITTYHAGIVPLVLVLVHHRHQRSIQW